MVPGDWNSQDDRLLYYEGTLWYRRLFDYPAPAAGRRVFLRFGAANYQADVYLNGRKLGRHVGGFTPFAFEVTDRLRAERNSLVVRVDNRRLREGVPTLNTDWWNYGGLTRDVPARGGAGDVRGAARAPPGRRLARPHRRAAPCSTGRRVPITCASRSPSCGVSQELAAGAGRRVRRGGARAAARALDARAPAALRGRPRGGRRSGHRPGRLPHDRHARGRDPAERTARLPARDLDPRGEPDARRARLLAGGRAPPARLGEGARLQLRAPRALPAQRAHGARGRRARADGVGGDPGLLDDRLGERRTRCRTRRTS